MADEPRSPSMWNKRFSSFLLIKIRHKAFRFAFPIPIYIFEDLLQAMVDFFSFWESLLGRQTRPGLVLAMGHSLLRELRCLGRWQLVEVSDREIQISVSFY